MTDAGDVHLADLNQERRRHVLVVSNRRFNRTSDRVLVAPEITSAPDGVEFPWRVEVDGTIFAVDLMRSLPAERLLERTNRASADAMRQVRRALLQIT